VAALKHLGQAYGGIRAAVATATWILTGVLVALVCLNVFARYVLEIGIDWAEEVSRLVFVWVVFLGSYVALCRKGHMAIAMLMKRVPEPGRRLLATFSRLLVLAFLAALAWAGATLVGATLQFGRQSPILGISAAWGYASVPAAAALMFLEVLRELLTGELPRLDVAELEAVSADLAARPERAR
jgi:TRAP-type C4-dicarboxylate transport system permease small subunit